MHVCVPPPPTAAAATFYASNESETPTFTVILTPKFPDGKKTYAMAVYHLIHADTCTNYKSLVKLVKSF